MLNRIDNAKIILLLISSIIGMPKFYTRAYARTINSYTDQVKWKDYCSMLYLLCGYSGVNYAYNQYQLWSDRRDYKKIVELEKKFENLPNEEKERFVSLNLAIKDHADSISLKYICPLNETLIVHPAYLKVYDEARGEIVLEMYEKFVIKKWINKHPESNLIISPLTLRNVVKDNGDFLVEPSDLLKEHRDYIRDLSNQFSWKNSCPSIRRFFYLNI